MSAYFEFLLRMGDNTLILGHRVSEWCGHAPVIEEDIALANTALDLIGQTQMWLGLAAEVEGKGRTADDLAMLRDAWDFRNVLMVEKPNGDFGQTLMRQFLFDAFHLEMLKGLTTSSEPRVAEIAAKAVKEVQYHVERSGDTVIGLGDGTAESHARMQDALNFMWPYVGEMFASDDVDAEMLSTGIAPDLTQLRIAFDAHVGAVMADATLTIPDSTFAHKGGKSGFQHTEHLGHILTQMQWLQRAYPGASW
ncbi:MAG: phenylacetate-CoA oxygenase subunit PaaC [Planktotalea sp.]|jgi:ring-1,2-phenylacetyl-CoA epoxidase subunit PaaC|uniref:1,2-phenylacetyl-CoA epoxidase subunit PaaC n=1 Tax=Planktotalea sp. TaxID=2029877 RepID=UPI001D4C957C|nr:1,2-phenylacetyl-CoA epoxidase subunit PaaC [Planktotalea sp.]MBT5820914.1 phenylacetate-CoA oxygenase subunit PaaC [Paracoccaceae bacterium]MDG1076453.1 phenylacetate-CoA oxygenase subunit PaaC [Planktotalea sp.]MDG1083439.1 phenylacetate-CoA oxygenase subunit PaaC [Planktotalea sp.]